MEKAGEMNREEKQVDGDEENVEDMKGRRRKGTGAASVKGHCVLLLDEQALRWTNKMLLQASSLLADTLDTVSSITDN